MLNPSSSPSGPFVVIHWRRGDQLSTRCAGPRDHDSTLNCVNSTFFLREVDALRLRHNISVVEATPYVATNEADPQILSELHGAGYATFENISDAVGQGLGRAPSSLDAFVVEMAMMIDADWFFAWGPSEVNPFAVDRRHEIGKYTVMNEMA